MSLLCDPVRSAGLRAIAESNEVPLTEGPRVRSLHWRVVPDHPDRSRRRSRKPTTSRKLGPHALVYDLPHRMISSTREKPSRKPSEGETMNWTERRERFRAILSGNHCVHPGSIYDAISARIAEDGSLRRRIARSIARRVERSPSVA